MREIKFRGKRTDNGEWIVGDYTRYPDEKSIIMVDILEEEDYWVSSETVGQYTGLKDKNGKEIYEGDVLFHPLQGRRKVYYPYSETVASYGLRDIDNGFGSTLQDGHAVWEIIGNIHEGEVQK